jgi:hypothetical protein
LIAKEHATKFPIPTRTIISSNNPNSHALELRQAYEDFRTEFHLHAPSLTDAEIYQTGATYVDITATLPLSKAQWICLLGKLLYALTEP